MKKFRLLSAFLMLVTLTGLISCSEEDTQLLNGGQDTDGSVQLNINYTIPGGEAQVFSATSVSADANGTTVTITAENEDTGESLVMSFAGNKISAPNAKAYPASVTYVDGAGNEYTALSPISDKDTGGVKLTEVNTAGKTISGVFSFIGYAADATVIEDGVPFYAGVFFNIPYTGSLPEPTPTEPEDTFMKATIDASDVDFSAASTVVNGTTTTFAGVNANPIYTLQLVFADNTAIAAGTFEIDVVDGPVSAQVTIGTSSYVGVSGSVIINSVTEGIVTGTFTFTGENGEGQVEVTAGSFKLPLE